MGTVKDASGAVVPGVALTITNDATGQERHLVSGSDGNFVATALPVGTYSVKAELASFKTQVRKGIVLQVAEQARVDLVLEVGEMTEEVTVEASAPLLRTENAEVSEVIDNQRVTSLPLNGRQFVDLTLLSDNVFVSPRGTRGSALAQTGPAVLVAGQRAGHNMYYLDGVSVTDQYFNHLVASPAIDGIQEFNIQKSLYSPEFADSWSLNVQRTLGGGWLAQATYFGSHVSGADNSTFANVPVPGPGVVDSRRPNPLISGFRMIRWDGWSIYHSGTFSIERRFARGIGLNMNYTWSKSMDDASDVGSTFSETNIPQDVRNVRAEKALSSFDHRQRLVFSYSYQLPFGKGHAFDPAGFAGKMVGGWTVNGLGSAQSGAPFTVILPGDTANIGAGPAQRPNLIGDPNADAPRMAQQWFNTSAFQTPTQFTFGSAGRNVVLGDDEVNTDLSLIKDTPVGERAQAQFRFEIFNLLNHANFLDVPGRTLGTQTFGSYSAAENPRQIQFALKLSF